jgi:para-nitrobenzyl esterase
MYNYNFVAPGDPIAILGARHGSELAYAFNTIALRGLTGKENESVAKEMHTRWVNFIKSGDPNGDATTPSATQWPKYDTEKTEVIFFDKEVTTGVLPDRENLDFMANILYGTAN